LGELVESTHQRAIEVLKRNATRRGLKASLAYYNQVWARDAFISFLGANLLKDPSLIQSARTTVDTFARTRAPLGQIANFYDLGTDQPEFGFSGSTDSSCWYVIGLASLYHATGERELLDDPLDAAIDAYRFVRYQDANNTWLVDSPQGADWMDAAIQRTGKTLYNNVLFLAATKCLAKLVSDSGKEVPPPGLLTYDSLKARLADVFLPDEGSAERIARYWPKLAAHHKDQKSFDTAGRYYLQYISFARIDGHFDTLSNLLCSLWGVASEGTANSILSTIFERKLASPYPIRVLDPPYRKGDPGYDVSFDETLPEQHRSGPLDYHNGGIWPFVGGFYVCSLFQAEKDYASEQLEDLAKANLALKQGESVGFNEWLGGKRGEAKGQYGQSWSAGMFIAAYSSSRGSDPFEFLR
jgi:glycogen debranching enzyme